MSEGISDHRKQGIGGSAEWQGGPPGLAAPDGLTPSSASDDSPWRLRNGLPQRLLQWAFAAETDRQEAKAVMEFVARLLDDPDVGQPSAPPVTDLPGTDDAPDIRHAVPEGTTTQVIWRFYRPLHWIEILAPGMAQTLQPGGNRASIVDRPAREEMQAHPDPPRHDSHTA